MGFTRDRARELRRAVLRALNGAALGMLLGGLLGAALGSVFARWVLHDAAPGAVYGIPPGTFAGILIGATVVVRHPGRALLAGSATGLGVGCLYAWLLFWTGGWGPITASMIASGAIGGPVLSLVIRWIRRRWPWWTRWETGNWDQHGFTAEGAEGAETTERSGKCSRGNTALPRTGRDTPSLQ